MPLRLIDPHRPMTDEVVQHRAALLAAVYTAKAAPIMADTLPGEPLRSIVLGEVYEHVGRLPRLVSYAVWRFDGTTLHKLTDCALDSYETLAAAAVPGHQVQAQRWAAEADAYEAYFRHRSRS